MHRKFNYQCSLPENIFSKGIQVRFIIISCTKVENNFLEIWLQQFALFPFPINKLKEHSIENNENTFTK